MRMGVFKSRHQQIAFYIDLTLPYWHLQFQFGTDFRRFFALSHITDGISIYPEFSTNNFKLFLLI